MASALDFVGELDGMAAAIDAEAIDKLSRTLVAKAAHDSGTVEGSLADFYACVFGDHVGEPDSTIDVAAIKEALANIRAKPRDTWTDTEEVMVEVYSNKLKGMGAA